MIIYKVKFSDISSYYRPHSLNVHQDKFPLSDLDRLPIARNKFAM